MTSFVYPQITQNDFHWEITIGQYLRPSFNHLAVKKYWNPSEFEYLYRFSKELGFKKVSSGPLVRSSYHAG